MFFQKLSKEHRSSYVFSKGGPIARVVSQPGTRQYVIELEVHPLAIVLVIVMWVLPCSRHGISHPWCWGSWTSALGAAIIVLPCVA